MFALRQLHAFLADGSETDMSAVSDFVAQLRDVNPRYILRLASSGDYAGDLCTLAASGGTYALQLPEAYDDTTNRLMVLLRSSETIKVTVVTAAGATNRVMVRAGANQDGLLAFSDNIASITLLNAGATAADVEWFLFTLPDIESVDGWRDGSLALGVTGSSTATSTPPSPAPEPPVTVSYVDSVHFDYATQGPVTNAAWVEIIASTAGDIAYLNIFHGFGAPVYLGVGAAGVEQIATLIPPGGLPGAQFLLTIAAGSRLSLKGVTATSINSGEFDLTGYI